MNRKDIRKEVKKIANEKEYVLDDEGRAVITAKADGEEQIFSQFDYDKGEKLNPELADYLFDKANHVPVRTDLRLKIFTFEDVNDSEVKFAIKRNFERGYKEQIKNSRDNWKLIIAMSILGVVLLSVLFLCYAFFNNAYITTILEIAVWVVIWEAVDAFVFSRAKIRKKSVVLLKLCTCEVEVVKILKKPKKK